MQKTKRLTVLSLLTAASLCVFVIEAQIPPLTAVPGVKAGLSNIFTIVTMTLFGTGSAAGLLLVRIVLGSIVTGRIAAMGYSLCGGLLAFVLLFVTKKLPRTQIWARSILSAIAHNIGQLLLASYVLGSDAVLWYLPVLILSALATGLFTGLTAQVVLRQLEKNKAISFQREEKRTGDET